MNDIVLVERLKHDVRDALRCKPFKGRLWHNETAPAQCHYPGSLHQAFDCPKTRFPRFKLYLREFQILRKLACALWWVKCELDAARRTPARGAHALALNTELSAIHVSSHY